MYKNIFFVSLQILFIFFIGFFYLSDENINTISKSRSKNFDDMNCIEWLVSGLELAGYKIPDNVLTATTLSKWAEDKLSKIEKKNNLATFNKNY